MTRTVRGRGGGALIRACCREALGILLRFTGASSILSAPYLPPSGNDPGLPRSCARGT